MPLPSQVSQGNLISTWPLLGRRKFRTGEEEEEQQVPLSAEPNSVLEALISPTSSSTVSSSHGGVGPTLSVDATTIDQMLPNDNDHEQNILRLIMGDSQDPSLELNNILHPSLSGFGLDNSLLINQSQTHFTQNPSIFFSHSHHTPPTTTEQLMKAAEIIESGCDTYLANEILARLNQQLTSPIGNPFERASFYFKEALQKLLLYKNNESSQTLNHNYSLIFKIAAYKSFSEISPILQFSNFTSNQALLESFQTFHQIHIIDFDIGYGGQWASLMQELVLRDNNNVSLKITVFASPTTHHDELELAFTQENLKHFATEINISLDIQILSLDVIGTISWPSSENEAVAVKLSSTSFSNMTCVLRFVKHLSPTIIVCSDRGCERTDLSFPQQILHSLHSHAALLESLDAVNPNLDAMHKIERFFIQPEIEKLVMFRGCQIERTMMTWQKMFLEMGFLPVMNSNFTESQAECLVQRTPVRGFHVEKKQNSLLLCWQRRELVGVSAWKCRS